MAGTPNTDACALVNAPADSVVRQIVRIMREVRPHVVVTFDPQGGYGHPDHVAIHQHTVTAFHAAGDPTRYPDQGDPWQAMRLFYSVVPRAHLHALAEVVPPLFDAFERRAWPDEDVHVTQDVAATIPAKQAALHCHRTQVGPDHPLLHIPDASRGAILRYEHFALASPQPDAALRLADLFDGVEIPEPFGVH
jgi:LmbE family N-acetylglucosaminyl deacetylase